MLFWPSVFDEPNRIDFQVYELICDLIDKKNYVDFLVGRDGEYDQLVSSAIIRTKRKVFDANSSHIWIMPYKKAEYINNYEDYDAVEICEKSAGCHPKAAITICNQYMIDKSDFCAFYVNHKNGGACNALKYVKQHVKNIILLG